MTGAALTSAALVFAATPAPVPLNDVKVAAAPAPARLSNAKYELTGLSDISLDGIATAYWQGWGGYIQKDDPYFPWVNPTNANPIYSSGAAGALYYVIDNLLDGPLSTNLDNYFFEMGAATGAGLPALIYAATAQTFGVNSLPAFLADTIFMTGMTVTVQSLVLLATSGIPKIDLGPVQIGGGILAHLFFTGETPDGKYSYGNVGLSAIAGYIQHQISEALNPTPPTTPPPAADTLQRMSGVTALVSKIEQPKVESDLTAGWAEAAKAELTKLGLVKAVDKVAVTEPVVEKVTEPVVEKVTEPEVTTGGTVTTVPAGVDTPTASTPATGAETPAAETDVKTPAKGTTDSASAKPEKTKAAKQIGAALQKLTGGKGSKTDAADGSKSDSPGTDSTGSTGGSKGSSKRAHAGGVKGAHSAGSKGASSNGGSGGGSDSNGGGGDK
jgi:hypothetical protein